MFKELSWGRELQDIWIRLFNGNKYLYPYSSYEYAQICRKCFRWQTHRWLDKTRIFYYKNEETGAEIIAPLTWHKENIYIYGDWETARLLDFVYSENVANEDFEQLFCGLCDVVKIKKLNLNRLHDESLLRRYIEAQRTFKWKEENKRVCTTIDISNGYSSYWKGLTKNCRGNIRTAYNRLERDGQKNEFVVGITLNDRKRMSKQMTALYCGRQNEKYGKNYTGIRLWKYWFTDPMTYAMRDFSNGLWFLLNINGEPAAIFGGFITNSNVLFYPRCGMNSKYRFYSPGRIVIDKMIQWICANTDIKLLDFSNGDEPYKLTMGGKVTYVSHGYEVELV